MAERMRVRNMKRRQQQQCMNGKKGIHLMSVILFNIRKYILLCDFYRFGLEAV